MIITKKREYASYPPQYITNIAGEKLSVILPMQEYNAMVEELEKIELIRNSAATSDAPEWHQQIVSERLEEYRKNSSQALDFEASMDDIEAGL